MYLRTSDFVIIQMNNAARISVGERNTLVQLNITDDDYVEGVEYQTLMLSAGNIVGIQYEGGTLHTSGVETILFIEDNDGKFCCVYKKLARQGLSTAECNNILFITTQWLQLVFLLHCTLLLKGWR